MTSSQRAIPCYAFSNLDDIFLSNRHNSAGRYRKATALKLFGKKNEAQARFAFVKLTEEGVKVAKWYLLAGLFLTTGGESTPSLLADALKGKLRFKVKDSQMEKSINTSGSMIQHFFLRSDGFYKDKEGMTFEDWLKAAEESVELTL